MDFSPRAKAEPIPEPELDELDEDSDSADDNPNAFKIRGALPEYRESKHTVRKLHELIHEGGIDLEPSYQRDVVWTEAKQMALIHSLFHNYYIPPIVFAVHPAEDDPDEEVRTSRGVKSEIPEHQRERFLQHQITCVEYHALPPGAEHEVFQRVQMGMILTAAEKLQALSSPWAQWIRYLEHQHVGVEGGLATVLEWDTKRGRDFQNIAYLVCCCDYLPEKEEIPTAASITKWIEREDAPTEQFKTAITSVLVDLWNIGSDKHLNHGLKRIGSRLAPVEFIFVGVLLFVMRKRPLEDRASAITALRKGIRAEYKDVRLNSSVCKTMWSLIRSVSSGSHGHSDTKGKKRKKDDDDEDDDYRPTPVTGLGKSHTRSKKKTILS
ncbi:hypothetical protein DXG01_013915 [Tephrocybe rancida]|nr:hypothetical protein DXG01_013915 [Tephrocybe rancida]